MGNINVWEDPEPGVRRKIFEPGNGIMMMEVHFEENSIGKTHSHIHEQLTYCLEGLVEFTVDGVTRTISAGEAIYIPSGALHGCRALKASKLLDAFTPVRQDLINR
ncbi:cupin domain-containing protein [Cohnella hongkongensis]|uniref:Cupin domain-containing protein n=1 Tax=Cohnella hongkongensis TaxID=178337 RepID=A0ABV9FLR1_9BACL